MGDTVARPTHSFWLQEHVQELSPSPLLAASQKLSKTSRGSWGVPRPVEQSRCDSQMALPIPANNEDISHIRHFADTLMRANKGSVMQMRGCREAALRVGFAMLLLATTAATQEQEEAGCQGAVTCMGPSTA